MGTILTAIQKVELDALGKQWDNREAMTLKAKKKLLGEAGHTPNAFAYRAWAGISLQVKLDMLYVQHRNTTQRKGITNV